MPEVQDLIWDTINEPGFRRRLVTGTALAGVLLALAAVGHSENPIRTPKGTVELASNEQGVRKFLPPAGTADQVDCGASDTFLWVLPPTQTYKRSIEIQQQDGREIEYVLCGTPSAEIPQQISVHNFTPEAPDD